MALQDASLPKKYKNGKVLFEQNLDAWRKRAEELFNTLNLNLTQLRKDCFLSNYDYTNTGVNAIPQSLQQQINLISSGGIPLSGTTSDTWTINTDGFSATLSTSGLSDFRTYTFPDTSGEIVLKDNTVTLTNKTLTSPNIGGTVSGGASYTSVTLTGTVSGGATYTSVTLTTPTIASFTNAQHSHANAAGGGQLDWDVVWSDAVHSHQSNAEGGTLDGAAITSTITGSGNVVKSASPTLSGTVTIGQGDVLQLDPTGGNEAQITTVAGKMLFAAAGAGRFQITSTGINGWSNNAQDLGTSALKWRGIFLSVLTNPTAANEGDSSGFAKAWAKIDSDASIFTSYNINSSVHTGTGIYTIGWTTTFSSANYSITVTVLGQPYTAYITAQISSGIIVEIVDSGGVHRDAPFFLQAMGTQ